MLSFLLCWISDCSPTKTKWWSVEMFKWSPTWGWIYFFISIQHSFFYFVFLLKTCICCQVYSNIPNKHFVGFLHQRSSLVVNRWICFLNGCSKKRLYGSSQKTFSLFEKQIYSEKLFISIIQIVSDSWLLSIMKRNLNDCAIIRREFFLLPPSNWTLTGFKLIIELFSSACLTRIRADWRRQFLVTTSCETWYESRRISRAFMCVKSIFAFHRRRITINQSMRSRFLRKV